MRFKALTNSTEPGQAGRWVSRRFNGAGMAKLALSALPVVFALLFVPLFALVFSALFAPCGGWSAAWGGVGLWWFMG